ncbi:MAG: hypothetical protein K5648_10465 [Erysipelotrichaceae bacterium]|nr:hypothetical protein [Erysipelotrichaceae bacterium]
MNKFQCFFLWTLLLCLMAEPFGVFAEAEDYLLTDEADGYQESFRSFESAYDAFEREKEGHGNLLLKQGEEVLAMEYGIIEFKSDQSCSLILEYDSLVKHEKDYLNPCYGADALYLGTSRNGRVEFQIAADTGSIDMKDVKLIPLQDLKTPVSSYLVKEGKLIHNIRTRSGQDFFTYSIVFDEAPYFLKEGQTVYSFDGHYFYEDLMSLCDDLSGESHENALNETAYYNYYQYLPYRSYTAYEVSDLEGYFYDTLKTKGRLTSYFDHDGDGAADAIDLSQLYGNIKDFFVCESLYGSNALMLLSSAVYESSYGRSHDSFFDNDLFSSSVYETEEEKESRRYASVASSIYAHSRYFISKRFADHRRSDYTGTCFGDKVTGINVNYSIDPYYGEKCSAVYRRIDEALGRKDKDRYGSLILKDEEHVTFYRDEDLQRRYFQLDDVAELHLIVLEELEEAYKVRIDQSYSDEHLYDPSFSIAYLPKERVFALLNEDKIEEESFDTRTLDLNGGNYMGMEEIKIFSDRIDSFIPHKEGYEFEGFDENGKAQYKKISRIELTSSLKMKLKDIEEIDLEDPDLRVIYEDASYRILPLSSDLVRITQEEESDRYSLTISYEGLSLNYELQLSEKAVKEYEALNEAIKENDISAIKKRLPDLYHPLSFEQIRSFDRILKEKNKRNYVILNKEEGSDLSISGLDLSLDDKNSLSLMADTYYVIVERIKDEDKDKIFELAKGYGFEDVRGIDISFRFNYQSIGLRSPAIVQLDIQDKKKDKIYSVYHLDEDGHIVKCRTEYSDNYVQFRIEESGPYLVLSLPSVNEFDLPDGIEDLTYDNMGFDKHKTNFELMGTLVITLTGLIGITLYYIIYNERKRLWRDFRRSLQQAGIAQEEGPKN